MALYRLLPGYVDSIRKSAVSELLADPFLNIDGGCVVNPVSARDQNLAIAESLFVNLLGSAAIVGGGGYPGNTEVVPGQWFVVPPGATVWVTAASAGHKFTSFFKTTYKVSYPPETVPGQPEGPITGGSDEVAIAAEPGTVPFPPSNVTGLTEVIPSFLYQQYTDDDDLQGFVQSQNEMQQDYVDTFNALNLPIYTGPVVQGALLDWVARGLYGIARPSLGSIQLNLFGLVNTYGYNWLVPMWDLFDFSMETPFGLNMIGLYGPIDVYLTNDDVYRRIITWHFFKADGNYCTVEWLKRRIWRFLYCPDGTSTDWAIDPLLEKPHESGMSDPDDVFIANTHQISITFGVDRNVTIRFVLGLRTVNAFGGALMNCIGCNGMEPTRGLSPRPPPADTGGGAWDIGVDATPSPTGISRPAGIYLNDLETTRVEYEPLPFMKIFKEALDLGVLEVPYQFNFTCVIG